MYINLPENWKTTLGGLLIGLSGLLPLTPLVVTYPWLPTFLTALGGLLLGFTAKDSTTHSTTAEVAKATVAEVKKAEVKAGG